MAHTRRASPHNFPGQPLAGRVARGGELRTSASGRRGAWRGAASWIWAAGGAGLGPWTRGFGARSREIGRGALEVKPACARRPQSGTAPQPRTPGNGDAETGVPGSASG